MLALILTFCLASSGNGCVSERPDVSDLGGLLGCAVASQRLAAQYIEQHPGYVLRGSRCEIGTIPRREPA